MSKDETDTRNLAALKRELTDRSEGTDKRLDSFHRKLSIVKSNSVDILQLRATVNETHTCTNRSDDHTTSQGDKNQELDRRWEDHADQITALELVMSNRTEDLQVCQ